MNNVDTFKLSPQEYLDSIKSIFAICNRSKLTPQDLNILMKEKYIRNKKGEKLIYYYIQKKATDVNLLQKMINNGHYLNKEDYRNLIEIIIKKHYNSQKQYDKELPKILWLFDSYADSNLNDDTRQTFTYLIFHTYFLWYGNTSTTTRIFELIKTLYEKNYLKKDLRKITPTFSFIPYKYTQSPELLQWFDDNFIIDWTNGFPFYTFMLKHKSLVHEYVDWFVKKDPYFLSDSNISMGFNTSQNRTNIMNYSIISSCYTCIFEKYNVKPSCIKQFWSNRVNYIMTNDDDYNYLHGWNIHCKQLFLFGIIKREITNIPLGLIRIFNIHKEDLVEFEKNKNIIYKRILFNGATYRDYYNMKASAHGIKKTNMLSIFVEDLKEQHPDLTEKQLKDKFRFLKYDFYNAMNKAECIAEHKKIMDYLNQDGSSESS